MAVFRTWFPVCADNKNLSSGKLLDARKLPVTVSHLKDQPGSGESYSLFFSTLWKYFYKTHKRVAIQVGKNRGKWTEFNEQFR